MTIDEEVDNLLGPEVAAFYKKLNQIAQAMREARVELELRLEPYIPSGHFTAGTPLAL